MDTSREFIIRGRRYAASRRSVEERLAREEPEAVRKYSVEIGGRRFPLKQAMAVGLGLPRVSFTSQDAFRVLQRLGFEPIEESN